MRVWGLPIWVSKHGGYRPWLENEIGLHLASDYVDYLDCHLLFPRASTPPGNWLALRSAKQIYDDHPAARDHVRKVLLRLESRVPPLLNSSDHYALEAFPREAEQDAAADANKPRR